MLKVNDLRHIVIGRELDGYVDIIEIDCSEWLTAYPELTDYRIEVTSPDGTVYLANTSMIGSTLQWTIMPHDTAMPGNGMFQVVATGANGERKTSSHPRITVLDIMDGVAGDTPPPYASSWLDDIQDKVEEVEDAADRAEEAAGKAEDATSKMPMIGDSGNWMVYDAVSGVYADTGISAVGDDGRDGISPTVSIEKIDGGHRITVTDTDGEKSFDVLDGDDEHDGGYYLPEVNDGILTWSASKEGMPAVPECVIKGSDGAKGEKGDAFTYDDFTEEQLESLKGETGAGVHAGDDEPTDESVVLWIDMDGEADSLIGLYVGKEYAGMTLTVDHDGKLSAAKHSVNESTNHEWELIETITLNAAAPIVKNTYPDGAAYRLECAQVKLMCPKDAAIDSYHASGVARFYFDESAFIMSANPAMVSTSGNTYTLFGECSKDKGYWSISPATSASARTQAQKPTPSPYGTYKDRFDKRVSDYPYITKIMVMSLASDSALPAGTVAEIWGVKANA